MRRPRDSWHPATSGVALPSRSIAAPSYGLRSAHFPIAGAGRSARPARSARGVPRAVRARSPIGSLIEACWFSLVPIPKKKSARPVRRRFSPEDGEGRLATEPGSLATPVGGDLPPLFHRLDERQDSPNDLAGEGGPSVNHPVQFWRQRHGMTRGVIWCRRFPASFQPAAP